MFCPKCGVETPDGSEFCRKCGNALTGTGNATTLVSATAAKSNRVHPALLIGLLIALGVFGLLIVNSLNQQRDAAARRAAAQVNVQPVSPVLHTMNIGKGALAVAAMHYAYYSLAAPAGARNVRVQGRFTATGGAGNDIFVFLLNEDEFTNWKNRHQVPAYYSSGKVTVGDVNAVLPNDAGTYYLVFDNRFSMLTAKAVEFTGTMTYYQ
jgi:hypothetical protein